MARFLITNPWTGALPGRPVVTLTAGYIADDAFTNIAELRGAGVPLVLLTPPMEAALAAYQAQTSRPAPPELVAFLLGGAGGAASTGYTPTTPANWVPPLPTTVGEALDRLAAAGGVTPVP
jgi:hypothetical protein